MRLTVEQFGVRSGIDHQAIALWISRGWLLTDDDTLSDADAARARLIRDLLGDFGVNEEGVDIVLYLTDQLLTLRATIGRPE